MLVFTSAQCIRPPLAPRPARPTRTLRRGRRLACQSGTCMHPHAPLSPCSCTTLSRAAAQRTPILAATWSLTHPRSAHVRAKLWQRHGRPPPLCPHAAIPFSPASDQSHPRRLTERTHAPMRAPPAYTKPKCPRRRNTCRGRRFPGVDPVTNFMVRRNGGANSNLHQQRPAAPAAERP